MTEEIKQLHNRATRGEKLTSAELSALQTWYDENDKSEDILLNQCKSESDLPHLNKQLSKILRQVSQSVTKVEKLTYQNASIKQENEILRRVVENQLLEKAA
jgi:hypothetical protein